MEVNTVEGGKKTSKYAKGALILLVSGIICKFFGAFYRIPLTNILGAEGIGIYQLIFPVYSLSLILISGGVPIALSKLVAECRAREEYSRAKRFLWQSFLFLAIISLIFSALFILFSSYIATFQGNASAELGYFAVAGAIFFASVLTAFRGYFQGFQNMLPTAVSQIIEQLLKLILGLTLASVLMKYGVAYGVLGAMLGIVVSEVFALFYLWITYVNRRKKDKKVGVKTKAKYSSDFKLLFKRVFPITLNSSILPLIIAIDSFLIINLLVKIGISNSTSTQMFGIYSGMVNSLINLPTIVSLALSVSLVPAISYKRERGESAGDLISSSIKIVFFIALPSITMFAFFPNEIMSVLYPSATTPELLNLGANLLRISSINILYISLLQISTAILQASNKGFISLLNLFFAGVIKVILTVFFVLSPLNIYGAAISSIICFAFASGLNLIALKNDFDFSLKTKTFFYILFASSIMLGVTLSLNYLFSLFAGSILTLTVSMVTGGLVYLFLILILPVFNERELLKIPFGATVHKLRCAVRLKK